MEWTGSRVLAQNSLPSVAALHLVAGMPTRDGVQSYAVEVYRLDPTRGNLNFLYSVGDQKAGVDFIRADFSSRRLVVASPRLMPTRLDVIDFDHVETGEGIPVSLSGLPVSAWVPWPPGAFGNGQVVPGDLVSLVGAFFFERPGFPDRWLGLRFGGGRGTLAIAFSLGSELRREILDSAEIGRVRVQGDFGVLRQLGDSDALFVNTRDGKTFLAQTELGIPAPEPPSSRNVLWRLVAHDGRTSVMYRADNGGKRNDSEDLTPLYVRSAPGQEWNTYNVPGSIPRIKMIDSWLIGAAVSDARGRESPGAQLRRAYHADAAKHRLREEKMPTDSVFEHAGTYVPGILFLLDTAKGRYFEIRTDQGDSEILLVREDSVYYRINNSLFVAPLNAGSIGPGRLLVTNDAIPDVHWAFWGS